MNLSVNGRFYAARPTGVQRVAGELVERLVTRADVTLHLPAGCAVPDAVADRCTPIRGTLRGIAWEQVELPWRRARQPPALPLDPANSGSLAGRPGVMILHDVLPLTHPGFFAPAFRRWFALGPARAARRAVRVVTFSGWARDRMVEVLGLDPARVVVISQGVEPFHEPCPPERVRATLSRMELPHRFVLALGGGDPRKDGGFAERILAAWPRGSGPAPHLVVVGQSDARIQSADGPGSEGAPFTASPDAGTVRRLGHVPDEDLHALLTGASVFCFPSRAEGFGRPPLEAMACGTPAVVGDYGCAREILGEGAVIQPLDPAAWAESIADLLDEGPERDRRIAAGRAWAERFRWDDAGDELLEVCRSAAGASQGVRLEPSDTRRPGAAAAGVTARRR